ncbi:MAG: DNA-protecting protein DprA [Campylobacteraceae bacterium]|jgi:DNA processing protein|nr:DNA-protecting protein DprA [Campylobacteraceae bacterium]
MINTINFHINELNSMKKYPNELFYIGDTSLLKRQKISIVGTRKPTQYTKQFTANLASQLSNSGICVVSGAAMGVDAIAHTNAGYENTIAVVANGLNIRYPAINNKLIQSIEEKGLMLSSYSNNTRPTRYSFVHRNEIVVALGDILIVTQADLNSGSLRSVEYALSMGKKVYTLPHRIGESEGTNKLLEDGNATAIYNIEQFIKDLGFESNGQNSNDELLNYCLNNPVYDDVVSKFGHKVFEYELLGKIKIENGRVIAL